MSIQLSTLPGICRKQELCICRPFGAVGAGVVNLGGGGGMDSKKSVLRRSFGQYFIKGERGLPCIVPNWWRCYTSSSDTGDERTWVGLGG